ncbi:MAG: nucleotidyltransferase [Firmicutes bacterium]|nr:nucleotidyltransferase [Bacillota bacterium]
MNITGIIAEYDPFHNGHAYHIKWAKKVTGAECIVVVMSGPFVQRGMPSFFSKSDRAAMAVNGGADLVVELPYIYACNSSREFAKGGVNILKRLGINNLVFGCETEDAELLKRAARFMLSEDIRFKIKIKDFLSRGISYPEAFTRTVGEIYGSRAGEVLRNPNDLLAVEYIKQIELSGGGINVFPVKRLIAEHNSDAAPQNGVIASGTAVRNIIQEKGAKASIPYVPKFTGEIINKRFGEDFSAKILLDYGFCSPNLSRKNVNEKLFELLKYKIVVTPAEKLSEIYSVDEGIENRLKSAIADCGNLHEYAMKVKSKRYTLARINRMFIHILMGLLRYDFNRLTETYYGRVLGFSDTGRKLLRKLNKKSDIPVLSNLNKTDRYGKNVQDCLKYDITASDLYNLLMREPLDSEKKYVPFGIIFED